MGKKEKKLDYSNYIKKVGLVIWEKILFHKVY